MTASRLRISVVTELSEIYRTSVKNLRMAWAMAVGGMQDVGQNGLEAEMHALVDNTASSAESLRCD